MHRRRRSAQFELQTLKPLDALRVAALPGGEKFVDVSLSISLAVALGAQHSGASLGL